MRRVVLHVDRLLLRGFAHSDAAPFSAALRAELQSLLGGDAAIEGLSRYRGSYAVRAGTVRVPNGGSPAAIGCAVADRIVHGENS